MTKLLNFLEKLEKSFDDDKSEKGAKKFCRMHYRYKGEQTVAYAHTYFDKIDFNKEYVEGYFKCNFPKGLWELYEKFNGINIYFGTFAIWGQWREDRKEYSPFNMAMENYKILEEQKTHKDKDTILKRHYFANSGGDYNIFFLKDSGEEIYCSKLNEVRVIVKWNNFDCFVNDVFERIAPLYNEKCELKELKNDFNIKTKRFPALRNMTIDLFDKEYNDKSINILF